MTDEEINRKFDTVADHLATLAVGLDRLSEQVGKVSDKVDRTADGITSLLAIAEIHDREITELAESVKAVDSRQREADERARNMDERLNVLVGVVERIISERQNGKGGG